MLKNAYFWEKTVKLSRRRGLRPRTPSYFRRLGALPLRSPRCYSRLLLQLFQVYF